MKLGFYYHIPISLKGDKIFVPSYHGIFLEELSLFFDLYLICHVENNEFNNYELKNNNIVIISLGKKTNTINRVFFYRKLFKFKLKDFETLDAILIRSPSPLASFFREYFKGKIFYLIVGDYKESAKLIKYKNTNYLRTFSIKILNYYMDYLLSKSLKDEIIFVNSIKLKEKYEKISKKIYLTKTTTIKRNDIYKRDIFQLGNLINLIFTGRFDLSKGLIELFKSVKILISKGFDVKLNMVGWFDNEKSEIYIKNLIKELKIEDKIIIFPKMDICDLLQFYRKCDIFVLPSYQEGFPRTVWEAMASSIPVVVTKVGGIPYYLSDRENAMLVPPKDIEQLSLAIEQLILNIDLRRKIVKNALNLVEEATIENQIMNLSKIIYFDYQN